MKKMSRKGVKTVAGLYLYVGSILLTENIILGVGLASVIYATILLVVYFLEEEGEK